MSDTLQPPSLSQLFLGFLRIGMFGFGGVGALARYVIVEEKRWMAERDYAEILGMGQVLPGPNVGNASVMIGRRFHGLPGALAASIGLYAAPFAILLALCVLYEGFGSDPRVQLVMQGVAAAAAGLIIGTGLKMTQKLKPTPEFIAIGLMAVFAAAWLRWPLPLIVVVLAPAAIGAALWRAKAAKTVKEAK